MTLLVSNDSVVVIGGAFGVQRLSVVISSRMQLKMTRAALNAVDPN